MVDRTWSLKVPRSSLDDPDTVLMLRLGAAANALQSTQRWFEAVRKANGPAGSRDRVASFLVGSAYLKETIDQLFRPNYLHIEALARDGGASTDLLQALRAMMSKKRGSLYKALLQTTRNKLVFHWDNEPFREWARRYRGSEVTWGRGKGTRKRDVVHWASSDAVVASVMPGATASQLAERFRQVGEASRVAIDVIECVTGSYLRRHGPKLYPPVDLANKRRI